MPISLSLKSAIQVSQPVKFKPVICPRPKRRNNNQLASAYLPGLWKKQTLHDKFALMLHSPIRMHTPEIKFHLTRLLREPKHRTSVVDSPAYTLIPCCSNVDIPISKIIESVLLSLTNDGCQLKGCVRSLFSMTTPTVR